MRRLIVALLALSWADVRPEIASASTGSAALRARGFESAYNLDHEQALEALREAIEADPNDPAAYRGLATILWLNMGLRRGTLSVDNVLGRVTQPATLWRPPPDLVALFRQHVERAMALAERQVRTAPTSADAHYQVGATVGLIASYTATIDGRFLGAIGAAKRAFDEHERVLALDPARLDAGLIVGTYRYVISALSLPMRWMAYLRGFGGNKEKGLELVEAAARYPSEAQTDAKLALVLIYNRERRYEDALRVLAELQRRYPRNRLLWLEAGATLLRAGRPADAEAALDTGVRQFEHDSRVRMFGEEALWMYKRGAARVAMAHYDAAESDLNRSIGSEGREWVHGRAHIELARIAAARGDTPRGRRELETAVRLTAKDNDAGGSAEARTLLQTLTR